jgi:hypothetical protein
MLTPRMALAPHVPDAETLMSTLMHRVMILLAAAVYAIAGLSPRGAMLCISPDHGWSDVVASRCETHGHRHPATCHADPSCEPSDADCHGGHDHGGDGHAPCTDVPIEHDEARTEAGRTVLAKTHDATGLSWPALYATTPWCEGRLQNGTNDADKPSHRWADAPPAHVTASLRAIVLRI